MTSSTLKVHFPKSIVDSLSLPNTVISLASPHHAEPGAFKAIVRQFKGDRYSW